MQPMLCMSTARLHATSACLTGAPEGLKAAQPSLSSLDQPCRLPALCQNLSEGMF